MTHALPGSSSSSSEAIFSAERARLLGLAYRALGSLDDAEDAVQDVWMRWNRTDITVIVNPAAWLTTVTTRLAIDMLRRRQRSMVDYVGPWLPEPILAADDPTRSLELAESLTGGFLTLLETLRPVERVAFLLVEVFGEPYAEVAAILDRSETACRQLVHRARQRVHDGRPRFRTDPVEASHVASAFAFAALNGDMNSLVSLIASDVELISDGGARRRAARHPIRQPAQVARFLINVSKKIPDGASFDTVCINGEPSLVVRVNGTPYLSLQIDVVRGQVRRVRIVMNQDKLGHLDAPALLT